MAHDVIMPALGMAQETGLILAWRKALGEPVKAGDVLMEVETDKAAMEVEAQADGFLTEVRAAEGAEVPVGEVIAVISARADDVKAAPAPAPKTTEAQKPAEVAKPADPAPVATTAAPAPTDPPRQSHQPAEPGGKLLASPKAKRLAAERGLDLGRLVQAGHPQPYRAADVEVLAGLGAAPADAAAGAGRQLARARVPAAVFDGFCAWLGEETAATPSEVLAVFAAGSLRLATGREAIGVLVTAPRRAPRYYAEAERRGLADLAPEAVEVATGARPELIVHDLTATRLSDVELAGSRVPALSVARDGDRLVLTLSAPAGQMDDDALIACLDALAGRLEEPLRHLL